MIFRKQVCSLVNLICANSGKESWSLRLDLLDFWIAFLLFVLSRSAAPLCSFFEYVVGVSACEASSSAISVKHLGAVRARFEQCLLLCPVASSFVSSILQQA
jgi:hypothetical protein